MAVEFETGSGNRVRLYFEKFAILLEEAYKMFEDWPEI